MEIEAELLVTVMVVFVIAGTIKGVIGMGLPTTALALLTIVVSPLEALGLNVMPMLITNMYQLYRADDKAQLVRSYTPFALSMMAVLLVFSFLAAGLGNDAIKLMIAVSIVLFVLNQLFGKGLSLPARYDRPAQLGLGAAAGVFGGLTSAWAVPITAYLVIRGVHPKQFVDASGFLITLGCLPLVVGYSATGIFHSELIGYGLAGTVAGLAGFAVGERVRSYLPAALFRKLVLAVFAVMGLRLGLAALMQLAT